MTVPAALIALSACGWMGDGPDAAAYRVEHSKGDPSYAAQIVCYGFEGDANPHVAFRDAVLRQATIRGVTVHFGPKSPTGRVDAIIVSDTSQGRPSPTDVVHGAPVFALTRQSGRNAGATTAIVLPSEPDSVAYAEAGRRAVDLIADYLRGMNVPGTVRVAHHLSDPSHASRTNGPRPERTR